MSWSDDQLAGHKRAQGYISATGATLGVGALGAAGLKSKTARKGAVKLSRLANQRDPQSGAKIVRGQRKVANSAQGLTIGSAGVGGIGGYNFAAIQSQEAKRAKAQKVKKNMTTSAWGIDHGVDVVEKAFYSGATRAVSRGTKRAKMDYIDRAMGKTPAPGSSHPRSYRVGNSAYGGVAATDSAARRVGAGAKKTAKNRKVQAGAGVAGLAGIGAGGGAGVAAYNDRVRKSAGAMVLRPAAKAGRASREGGVFGAHVRNLGDRATSGYRSTKVAAKTAPYRTKQAAKGAAASARRTAANNSYVRGVAGGAVTGGAITGGAYLGDKGYKKARGQ